MLISGTPQQFLRLTPNAENGMHSRLTPFYLKGSNQWLSSYQNSSINLEEYFNEYAIKITELFLVLDNRDSDIIVEFTIEQLQKLDDEFTKRLEFILTNVGSEGRASVMRLGAITMKIAMIFTIIRSFEINNLQDLIICNDADFDSALKLSGVILQHTIKTLRMMNDERLENCYRGKKLDYFYALPNDFTYAESQELAGEYGIKLRTAQKWVYEFRNKGFLINPEKGQFKKVG